MNRSTPFSTVTLSLLGSLAGAHAAFAQAPSDLAQLDFFEKNIRPVLANSCYECHSQDSKSLKGGLLVDTREGLLQGGDSGPAIVPGSPEKSLLMTSIRHEHKDPDMAMPPKKEKLSAAVLANFEAWLKMGAPDPRSGANRTKAASWDAAKAAEHWAFKPIANPPLPKTADPKKFVQNPIDRFVLQRLTEKKLTPSPKADKTTLLRRVSYDLTGLPPTAAELEAFLQDKAPDAYEKAVDRLLASPRYGERWGRHWLDIARYADTTGDRLNGRQHTPLYPNAWTYRDYVINAFNADLPYDRFILEQVAADKLPESTTDKSKLAALGFLTVGKRFMGNENDILDDRIDVVTKGVMGLTGACARCHDHKFDPIPTKDYYSLHGVFASSEEPGSKPVIGEPEANPQYKAFLTEVEKVQAEARNYEKGEALRLTVGMLEKAGDYLLAVEESSKTSDTSKKGGNFRLAARNRGLKAELAAVWADQLKQAELVHKKRKDSVLAPWITLAALPAEGFENKALEALAEMSASTSYNPVIVGMLIDKWPTSLNDVATVYTEAFDALRKELALPEFAGRKGGREPVTDKVLRSLSDHLMESLRKDVFAQNSAMIPEERTVARTFGVTFTNTQASFRNKIAAIELAHPGAPVRAMTLVDKAAPKDSNVLIRGEAKNPGPKVPRRFLTVLGGDDSKPFTQGSGRLELAQAIVNRDNPLTARVIANRFWQWHFGEAIVRTPSDFGTRSEPPTHPELLDWMATWLMDHGWSLKQLNKLIVTSATYQQDSKIQEGAMAADPTNQWLWRFNVQRLDFEQVRDTLLTVSASLDETAVGGRPFQLSGTSTAPAASVKKRYAAIDPSALPSNSNRRTVYAMVDRANLSDMFTTFDFANPEISTGERVLTTVPQQALFMMNSPFIAEQVRGLFQRKDFPHSGSDEDKLRFIFKTALLRQPSTRELEAAQQFLDSDPKSLVETASLISPGAELGSPRERGMKKEQVSSSSLPRPLNSWERYAQVLLLTNELMYLR
jgi:hypothetical protein